MDRHTPWIILAALLVALVIIRPATVEAEAEVIPPSGWSVSSAAAPDAQRRAGRWKDALGLPMAQVMSSPYDDRFRETIAVFTLPNPVSATSFDDASAAQALLQATVSGIVGTETAKVSGLRQTGEGATVAWSRWTVDKISYDCVLAPSGEDATLIVMAVRADALEDHRKLLDRVVRDLGGVTEAMPAFSLWIWRVGSIVIWLCLALGLHGLLLQVGDTEGDHNHAGRRAAVITFVLVIAGAIVTYIALADRELALVHAGSSRPGMIAWVTGAGICVAGLHFLLAARFDRGYVQSAPTSGVYSGTYAASGIHASLSQSAMRLVASESSAGIPRPSNNSAALGESSAHLPGMSNDTALGESSTSLARPAPIVDE